MKKMKIISQHLGHNAVSKLTKHVSCFLPTTTSNKRATELQLFDVKSYYCLFKLGQEGLKIIPVFTNLKE